MFAKLWKLCLPSCTDENALLLKQSSFSLSATNFLRSSVQPLYLCAKIAIFQLNFCKFEVATITKTIFILRGLHVTNPPIRLMHSTSIHPSTFWFADTYWKMLCRINLNLNRVTGHYSSSVAIEAVSVCLFAPFGVYTHLSKICFPDSNSKVLAPIALKPGLQDNAWARMLSKLVSVHWSGCVPVRLSGNVYICQHSRFGTLARTCFHYQFPTLES